MASWISQAPRQAEGCMDRPSASQLQRQAAVRERLQDEIESRQEKVPPFIFKALFKT